MKKVVLVRIDDRLIHGQVVTAWLKFYSADHLLIIDDQLSKNQIMMRLYKAAAPSDIDLRILNLEDSIEFLKDTSEGDDVIILMKGPEIIEELINNSIEIPHVVLGGMGSSPARTQFIKNIYASEDEKSSFKRITDGGVPVMYQLVPDDKPIDIKTIL